MDNLAKITKYYKKFIKNKNYVYKLCNDVLSKKDHNKKWLVILKFLPETKTNELRNNVSDKAFAKFRADKLEVVKIININDPKKTKKYIVSEFIKNDEIIIKTLYMVGEIVEPEYYDEKINSICSGGIHYFRTLERAYYYRELPPDYTGIWKAWYDNGNINHECNYLNNTGNKPFLEKGIIGQSSAIIQTQINVYWIDYYETGGKKAEGKLINYKRHGKWLQYYPNGHNSMIGEYLNGVEHGLFTNFNENGKKKSEGHYVNGFEEGEWYVWNIHEDKILEGVYENGKKIYGIQFTNQTKCSC